MRKTILLTQYILVLLGMFSVALGDDQQQKKNKGWPCAARIDPSYIQVTEESGGQILMLDPSETRDSMALMEARLAGNEETIFRVSGEMNGEEEFSIVVDSTIESITFSSFIQCMKGIQLIRPDAQEILGQESETNDHRYISGRVVTIQQPSTGNWKLRVSGSGYFSVLAEAKTDLSLELKFVEPGGRPGHEGYFPINRPLRYMKEEVLSVELDAPVQSARIIMVDRNGSEIKRLQLTETSRTDEGVEYLGPVEISEETFRILVEGEDAAGVRYQRYASILFRSQPN